MIVKINCVESTDDYKTSYEKLLLKYGDKKGKYFIMKSINRRECCDDYLVYEVLENA